MIFLLTIYLAFISLGLPDAVLGAAWPQMHTQLQVPLSYSGGIFAIISIGTTISSIYSAALSRRFQTVTITVFSIFLTLLGLFGFSISASYWQVCAWAVPYGLGAGSIDAVLNSYVAAHYENRHMNWLHCMWGLGASAGPIIMAHALKTATWRAGYSSLALIQLVVMILVGLSIPLWKREHANNEIQKVKPKRGFNRLILWCCLAFFVYVAIEQTVGLWISSYLVTFEGASMTLAAQSASLFYVGITIGRLLAGLISMSLKDRTLLRLSCVVLLVGIGWIANLPYPVVGSFFIGLGCAPIYPTMIHASASTPNVDSLDLIAGEMSAASLGMLVMPPVIGLLPLQLFPLCLLILLAILAVLIYRIF